MSHNRKASYSESQTINGCDPAFERSGRIGHAIFAATTAAGFTFYAGLLWWVTG